MAGLYSFVRCIWYGQSLDEPENIATPAISESSAISEAPASDGNGIEEQLAHRHRLRATPYLKTPRRLIFSPTKSHRTPPRTPTKASARTVGKNCPYCRAKVRVNVKTGAVTNMSKTAEAESLGKRPKRLGWYYVPIETTTRDDDAPDVHEPRTLRSGRTVKYL